MPEPIALCIEDLDAVDEDRRYLRCVALTGRQPGLRLDDRGGAHWCSPGEPAACELWVSADQRLILFRPEEDGPVVRVTRGGRGLEVPAGKPVVLIDQDGVEVGGRRLRIHVHGVAPAVSAPDYLVPERRGSGRLMRAAAAALALGAAVGAGGCKRVEVRDTPPSVEPVPEKVAPDARPPDTKPAPPPVEVRDRPPEAKPVKPPGTPKKAQ